MVASCSLKEDAILPDSSSDNGTKLVRAYVENFTRRDVSTKASDAQESEISNLALMVFATPKNGTERVLITDPVYVKGEMLNFVINTTETTDGEEGEGQYISNIQSQEPPKYFGDFDGSLENCRIYIMANMNTLLDGNVTTESDLLNIQYTVLREGANIETLGPKLIDVPTGGFPMIGWADNVNLSPNATSGAGSQTALTISLKKLFAKINVKFLVQLDTENIPNGMDMVKTPYFAPEEWSVHNIPTQIPVSEYEASIKPVENVFSTSNFTSFNFSTEESRLNKRIENSTSGNEYFDFSFYVPEYKVLPANHSEEKPYDYPDKIDENSKQFFKPVLVDAEKQSATYVRIKGRYSDHQGYISQVEYKLYLGQNHTDDFQILRNQQLNNTAIIKGLTNHANATDQTISVDHRVDIVSSGYSIAMERETLLDSHFEIRPMLISVQEGAVVVVKIPQKDDSWFGAERADSPINSNTDLYEARGNRKFFTDGLIDEVGTKNAAKEFVFNGPTPIDNDIIEENNYRLWFYFDENVANPYDADPDKSGLENNKLFREGYAYVDYYENGAAYTSGKPTKADREFTFRQMNLWAIHADINDYNIEYFEEYLYNYASDDHYGDTTDGMKWGLKNEPLSTNYPAVYIDKDDVGGWGEDIIGGLLGFSFQGILNQLFSQIDEKYDFYLSRDNVSQARDYAGLDFTKEIVNKVGINNNLLTLSGDASSAVEYCYNKNKRNPETGKVDVIKWYLPAIDETEEILVAGFNYFDVFQSKYYWSSQPSFNKHNFNASSLSTAVSGAYYSDDTANARATIVTADGPAAESGVNGAIEIVPFTVNVLGGSIQKGTATKSTQTAQAGNQPRDKDNRVRCAYAINGLPHVYGTYRVGMSTSANGRISYITVTINKSDDPTKGNIMLSNYLHGTYNEIGYPQYANYDKATGLLTISMNQVVGIQEGALWEGDTIHRSVIYSGNTAINNGTLTLQYNKENSSFTVEGNNINLRTDNNTRTGYYFRSFTRN